MECRLLTISLSILYISSTVLAAVRIEPNYDDVDNMEKRYDIKGTIFLNCKIIKDSKDAVSHVKWERGDKDVESISALHERLMIRDPDNSVYGIKISKANEDDAGNYTCIAMDGKNEVIRANISLVSKYRVKTINSINFVEGENLKIPCVVYGKPSPSISWKVGNETYTESKDRITLLKSDDGIENAIIFIKEAIMEDRNTYVCIGTPPDNDMPVSSSTIVRIKDKYAALWPFLGICAEVFILCAIILIYEKKRNKTELDESDTDQSPNEKNTTPDHGKDSNIRHRQ